MPNRPMLGVCSLPHSTFGITCRLVADTTARAQRHTRRSRGRQSVDPNFPSWSLELAAKRVGQKKVGDSCKPRRSRLSCNRHQKVGIREILMLSVATRLLLKVDHVLRSPLPKMSAHWPVNKRYGDVSPVIRRSTSEDAPYTGCNHLQQMAVGVAEVKSLGTIFPGLPQLNRNPQLRQPRLPCWKVGPGNGEGDVDRASCVCVCCGAFLEQ